MIYSSNFSIGVNIFFEIIKQSAQIIEKFDEYDIFGLEMHHNRKLDSPSGTAKTITNILLDCISRKKKAVYDRIEKKISPEELQFTSVRCGDIAGTHCVGFDSTFDSIELKHQAKNRIGFAGGSLLAARWIFSKEEGFFTEKDLLAHLLNHKEY